MKAVKEKVQIFSMLKQPSEMEDVPQKITLRDKLTLSSQILAQILLSLVPPIALVLTPVTNLFCFQ